ncbi:aldehyde dehydrogenase family protein [Thalassospira alkalitolerans]|uniref:aldehyde dehydrogenase family protein n=1 Tax=Thalassospira alkalitolerans TaxID=1293890 RepID=UPI0030EC19A8|tara:strand:- start:2291 stop:3736 length:1446 start_codon:yes stop_codon:yes gene_type:complete
MSRTANHYVAGSWVTATDGDQVDVLNPASGEVIGSAALGNQAIAEQAIAAARAAFETPGWSDNPRLRAKVLLDWADQMEANSAELAHLLTLENGKVLAQAQQEISFGIDEARYYAGLARNIFGRTTETGTGKMSLLTREAAGVASVIVPWNAPVTLLVRSVAPALAAGCTVVIKPAPQTPLINAAIVACFDELSDLPVGVVNSVNENGIEVGQALSTHPEIDVVSFTGATSTGKLVMASASETMKHLSLELGGKAPAILFDDADLDKAIAEISRSALVLSGQMCTAISRILIQESIAKEAVPRLKAAFEAAKVGPGLDPNSFMGPVIDRPTQQRLLSTVEQAGDEAELILRGNAGGDALSQGYFVTPTLFALQDASHDLIQNEHFGPIVSVETFSDEADAIARANATRFGLASSVFSTDLNRAMRMARKIRFGNVWLNCHNRLFPEAETGGYRESGIGRMHGVEALNDFLETKHIYFEAES